MGVALSSVMSFTTAHLAQAQPDSAFDESTVVIQLVILTVYVFSTSLEYANADNRSQILSRSKIHTKTSTELCSDNVYTESK